jgi:transcriptional antiterminator RfaH
MPHWYVIHTKPRQESQALENLQRQGYTTYCPQITLSKRRRNAWHQVTEPLFPRYLFIELTEGEDDFGPIRSTLGVSNMLRFGGKPAIIANDIIESLRQQERDDAKNSDTAELPVNRGDRVRVMDGPFAGLEGIFQNNSKDARVVILMELLGRENRVSVDRDNIIPA